MKTSIKLAGTTFGRRPDYIKYVKKAKRLNKKIWFSFRREKNNPNDNNAISVIAHVKEDGTHYRIGYVPKTESARLARHIDNGEKLYIYTGVIYGNLSVDILFKEKGEKQ